MTDDSDPAAVTAAPGSADSPSGTGGALVPAGAAEAGGGQAGQGEAGGTGAGGGRRFSLTGSMSMSFAVKGQTLTAALRVPASPEQPVTLAVATADGPPGGVSVGFTPASREFQVQGRLDQPVALGSVTLGPLDLMLSGRL
ncbi:hypothetical protein [Rhodospirillum centenum]|uniref:Uncharacterized protein n=1 Tax=Rhodospirillum centenum (strain ATCC 51521 / SW) TaxID=414684 RepID=B6IN87_RHOCS|nr:hypothetical protein [Rhodospirillum centenum]ACI98984.1 hypothetical protein RC1_1581 [Rhodospirillum centenum SW]